MKTVGNYILWLVIRGGRSGELVAIRVPLALFYSADGATFNFSVQ